MGKLKNALFSLKASGSLGGLLTFLRRRGRDIVEATPSPIDAQTAPQLAWRHMFNKCVDLWHSLSAAEKQAWESAARPHHMTGYAWYISQCLRPNPGIYLPLQGGTMAGGIDMAKFRILKLPLPTDIQEADTLGARNTRIAADIAFHAAIAAAHHARYTNAEADARIALHAALTATHGVASEIIGATFGNYTGNQIANRAIPHGLGETPKVVIMWCNYAAGQAAYMLIMAPTPSDICYISSIADSTLAVTAMDATNFYVGNAANFSQSGNGPLGYFWVAIG